MIEFKEFPKIARLKRETTITEKIDGTNACVIVTEDGQIAAQSRSRLITPEDDNFGFARWVADNAEELAKLGPGHHYGEWWGAGIQRRYGLAEKRFSLFNTARWNENNPNRPECCSVVPVLWQGDLSGVDTVLNQLRESGSVAAPGFMNPEGVVVYHSSSRTMFKVTLEKDEEWKGKSKAA